MLPFEKIYSKFHKPRHMAGNTVQNCAYCAADAHHGVKYAQLAQVGLGFDLTKLKIPLHLFEFGTRISFDNLIQKVWLSKALERN